MTFLSLFLINVAVSFLLSWVLVKFGIKNKKYYSRFTDAPWKFQEKIELDGTYKFKAEYALSFLLIPFALILLALLSYVLSRPVPGIDQFEFFLMCMFGEFIIVLSVAIMIRATFETIYQDKELRNRYGKDLYLADEGIYFPIAPLEGEWRETARKAGKNMLYLKYKSITELEVLPSSGMYWRPKPAYYKITLEDAPIPVHIQRNQFYGKEKSFLDKISDKVKITYQDELK